MAAPLPKSKRPHWLPQKKSGGWSKAEHLKFLNTSAWRKTAQAHKMQNPLCVMCLEEGVYTPAEQTDHIREVKDGGALLDFDNLQSLCRRHHMIKSNRERIRRKQAGGKGGSPQGCL